MNATKSNTKQLTCAIATMVLVTEVPILAPMIINIAGFTMRTVKWRNLIGEC